MGKSTIYKWPFSIAMLVYQRVLGLSWDLLGVYCCSRPRSRTYQMVDLCQQMFGSLFNLRHGKSSALASLLLLDGDSAWSSRFWSASGFALPTLLGLAGGLLVQAWAIRPIYFWGFPAETGVQLQSWLALLLSEQEPDSVVKRWYATLLLVLLSREGWQNWLCSSPAATRLQVWARVTHFMAYKAWELRLHENLLLGDRVLPEVLQM